MATYLVHLHNTVSCTVEVEANSELEARESVFESDDMPGGITVGAFAGSNYIDDGEWEVESAELAV